MSVNKHRHAHNCTKPYYDSDGWSTTTAYEWRAETPSFEVETSNVTALQIGHSRLLVTAYYHSNAWSDRQAAGMCVETFVKFSEKSPCL